MPFIDAIDQSELECLRDVGLSFLPSVRQRLAKRELSAAFLYEWGQLSAAAGALQLIYSMETNVGHARSAVAGRANNLDAHRRWFSHYFLRLYKHGDFEFVINTMEKFINDIVDKRIILSGGRGEWFLRFLSEEDSDFYEGGKKLTKAFRKDLSASEMKKLNELPKDDLTCPPFSCRS